MRKRRKKFLKMMGNHKKAFLKKHLTPLGGFAFALLCLFSLTTNCVAQTNEQLSRTYLTPFPENDRYNIYVIGDGLGEGLWSGMTEIMKGDTRFEVFRKIHYGTVFARTSGADWAARLEEVLMLEKVHVAVIFTGAAERRDIWTKGKKLSIGSDGWREIVSARVDRLIRRLQRARVAIYWVGVPIMQAQSINTQMQSLNDVFRERTFLNGAKFIDTWNAFADQFGRYSAFGPDASGTAKRLRAKDGIMFTQHGNAKLANFVHKEILKDLAIARAERNVPLAGNEKEQRRINEQTKKKPPARFPTRKTAAGNASPEAKGWVSLVTEKKEGGEETAIGEIKILRPKLSQDLAQGFSSRSRKLASSAFVGEQVAKQMSGDLTALSSISPVNALGLQTVKQRVPLAQTPYYKVLIKGERQQPKPGRADDFAWPKKPESPTKSGMLQKLEGKISSQGGG